MQNFVAIRYRLVLITPGYEDPVKRARLGPTNGPLGLENENFFLQASWLMFPSAHAKFRSNPISFGHDNARL